MDQLPFSADGLAATQALRMEGSCSGGELFIRQLYERYTESDHATWRALYSRLQPRWERYANPHFMDGLHALCLPHDRVPRLADVNLFLGARTGFQARAVSGYVPAYRFFDCLRQREFPTTVTIRPAESLDYLPEPDIFHDVAGHVPMHTDPAFAEVLVRFGECARTATEIAAGVADRAERLRRLESIVKALARFFWFTVEFGLMRSHEGLRAYGSGLLSSYGELAYALDSDGVQRSPAALDWIIQQPFEIDHYQPLLFIVDSFDHLYDLAGTLERWMRAGRLDHVAPGEPAVSRTDLESFCIACCSH